MPILRPIGDPGKLLDILNYCNRDGVENNSNDLKGLTRGVNCSCYMLQAYKEMQILKKFYSKCKGKGNKDREYHHYVLSFSKTEFKPTNMRDVQNALNYTEKLVNSIFGRRFQIWLCAHVNSKGSEEDGGCLHVHIVIHSVDFNGKKLQTDPTDLDKMRNINDAIAITYGFSPIDRSPEAVAARGRAQLYSRKKYYTRHEKIDMGILRLQAAVAITKALNTKPANWDGFCNIMRRDGWEAIIRGRDISFRSLSKKYDSGKDIVLRASSIAKAYKHADVSPYAILKDLNYQGFGEFKKRYKPYKQQCADDILWVFENKKPKKFRDFAEEMNKLGWIPKVTKRNCIVFERVSAKRKNKSKICYAANRLAKDYNNLNLSSLIIMQKCGERNYVDYRPRGVIGPSVCYASETIADKLRSLQPNMEQSIPVRKNNMKVDLSGDYSSKKEDSSLSI